MTIFVSMGEEKVLKNIEDTIGKYFHFNKMKFSSCTLSSFTVVRDMYIHQENFLLLDIGGEVTNISMIKKNILCESISFPLGCNFLPRGVSFDLGCTLSEADSLISLFNNGHAEKSVEQKLTETMNQLKEEWLKEFQKSLANISNDISIPSTIYMTIDKDFADFFSQTIKTEQFNQYTLTDSKFEVIFLSTQMFYLIAEFEKFAIRDSGIIIDSIYINRFLINLANKAGQK
jgi:cell division ATPase FtsA